MTTSRKPREEDLPRLAGQAVERALAARGSLQELSPEQAGQVGGALSLREVAVLQQPVLQIRPGDWVGPLLAQGLGQAVANPAVNVAVGLQRQF
ncbi:hypothetical protein [Pseudorhodoferax sp.]|uniref:hypothetical protein n=1 Tax=Pseudorhodoferax sp. TaxID=1993553 RepID=UPI0039E2E942